MFIQNFQNGKIYKDGSLYSLVIDEMTFEGKSVKAVLKMYSEATHTLLTKKSTKKSKGKK